MRARLPEPDTGLPATSVVASSAVTKASACARLTSVTCDRSFTMFTASVLSEMLTSSGLKLVACGEQVTRVVRFDAGNTYRGKVRPYTNDYLDAASGM